MGQAKKMARSPNVKKTAVKAKAQPSVPKGKGVPTDSQEAKAPPTRKTQSAPKDAKAMGASKDLQVSNPPADPKAKSAPKDTKAKHAPPAGQKAKAAPKAKSRAEEPKQETPDENTAKAVKASLARANTVDLKSVVATAPEPSTSDSEDQLDRICYRDPADNMDDEDKNPEGVTLEEVRQRKAVHARYMRFSRSLKRDLARLNPSMISITLFYL